MQHKCNHTVKNPKVSYTKCSEIILFAIDITEAQNAASQHYYSVYVTD